MLNCVNKLADEVYTCKYEESLRFSYRRRELGSIVVVSSEGDVVAAKVVVAASHERSAIAHFVDTVLKLVGALPGSPIAVTLACFVTVQHHQLR
jgi:hypothetical protein